MPTAAHLVQDDLALTTAQLGILFSAFFWTYALLQIPAGWLAERFGALRILAVGLAIWATATMLVGAVHSFAALLALRLLLGVGESAAFPCMSKVLATTVPVKDLGRANGIIAFGYLFGPAIGVYLGGVLLLSYGWRTTFWVFGAFSLIWLLPWSRIRSQVAAVPAERAAAAAASPPLGAVLGERSLWGASLAHFSANYTFYFMLTWLPLYLVRQRGFSTAAMTSIAGGAYLVNALSALAGGWLIDRIVKSGRTDLAYKGIAGASQLGSVACMLCMAMATPPVALAAIYAYQVLCGAASPCTFAASQILAGPVAAGRWVGIQNAIANLSGIVAPVLTALVIRDTQHFAPAFIAAAVISMLGFIAWVWIIPRVAPVDWSHTRATLPLRA